MNKLLNLLIIFLSLNYLLPFVINIIPSLPRDLLVINLCTSLGIFLVEFLYNYMITKYKYKTMTLKENIYKSLFSALVVFAGYYIYEDLKLHYNINIPGTTDDNSIRSVFIIFFMTFFIITKCLITP